MLILPRKNLNINDLTFSPVNGKAISRLYGGVLSFGYLPPGGISKTIIVQLNVSDVAWISNIKLSITSIPFETALTFKVGVLDYLDEGFEPEEEFVGIDYGASGEYSISVKNISSTKSQFVYLRAECQANSDIGTSVMFYNWRFEHDKHLESIVPADDDVELDNTIDTPPEDPSPNQPDGSIYVPPFFVKINGLGDIFTSAKQIGMGLGGTYNSEYSNIDFELFGGLKFSAYYPPEYINIIRTAQNQTLCSPSLNCYFTLSQKVEQDSTIIVGKWQLIIYIGSLFTNDGSLVSRAIYELNNSTTADGSYNLVSSEGGRAAMANIFPTTIGVSASTLDEIKTSEETLKSSYPATIINHLGMQLFE